MRWRPEMGVPLIDAMGVEELREFRNAYRRCSKETASGLVRARDCLQVVGLLVLYARERETALTERGRKGQEAARRAERLYAQLPGLARFREPSKRPRN